jgi:hypothetical protein
MPTIDLRPTELEYLSRHPQNLEVHCSCTSREPARSHTYADEACLPKLHMDRVDDLNSYNLDYDFGETVGIEGPLTPI